MTAHVLLAEDDGITRRLLTSVLQGAGYSVTAVGDGLDAIELFRQQQFDIVVSDIRMRNVDGMEVLLAARRLPDPPAVILMTGYASVETAIIALREGAFNYLTKPCKSAELLQAVADAILKRDSERRRLEAMRVIANEFAQMQNTMTIAVAPTPPPLERTVPPSQSEERFLRVGALEIDSFRHQANFDNQALHLTPIEYTILITLVRAHPRVVNYSEIVSQTHRYAVNDNEAQDLLKPHIRNLRRKIPPDYLITVRNIGYRLMDVNDDELAT
jgi:DNA-binding response OmpR family regulator